PELIEAVLDVLLEWELRRMEQVIALGVDIWVHMAWYEGTDFWSPRAFRRFLKPRLAQLAARAHAHGKPFRYIITRGWKPLAADLAEIGIDCLTGADPVQDKITLREAREALGERVCIMGGINSAVMLTHWETGEIRAAVRQAVETLGAKPGFILFPVDAVFNQQPWEKVEAVLDAWREFC
ncbi:MAG TPA: uroporphyrinogen decarboxylase family protein, partial [Anaerolineaceae bacterium]